MSLSYFSIPAPLVTPFGKNLHQRAAASMILMPIGIFIGDTYLTSVKGMPKIQISNEMAGFPPCWG